MGRLIRTMSAVVLNNHTSITHRLLGMSSRRFLRSEEFEMEFNISSKYEYDQPVCFLYNKTVQVGRITSIVAEFSPRYQTVSYSVMLSNSTLHTIGEVYLHPIEAIQKIM